MARKKKYKSIISYRKELERINDLMVGLVSVIMVFKKLPEIGLMKPKAGVIKEIVEQNSFLEFGKERIDNIYELGFIRLFASFEAFMYEYLKELYTTYPNSMPTDRKIQVSDIMEWKTQKVSGLLFLTISRLKILMTT